MSAQINLYHPRFLRQRDLVTLGNVVLAVLLVYAALAAASAWVWQEAAARREAASAAEAQLKSLTSQIEAATKAAAIRKPSAQLIADLERAEGVLRRRADIARLLEGGVIGSTGGFAEFLRGFARHVPEGLWLTGFTIGAGGNDMEIRGSMLNPGALPEYIRKLGTEKVFQGRNFAALTMSRVESAPAARPAGQGAGVVPAPTPAPRTVDFVLMPKLGDTKEARQ